MGKILSKAGKTVVVAFFLVLAVIFLVLGIKVIAGQPDSQSMVKDAVYAEDARVIDENEGKIVIVPGKLKAETPVVDPATYVSLDTISAYRKVQRFEKRYDSEEEVYVYEWKSVASDYSKENNYGVNGSKLAGGVVTAETKIGEFDIDLRLLNGLSKSEEIKHYSRDMMKDSPLHVEDNGGLKTVFLSERYDLPYGDKEGRAWDKYAGAIRISYQIVDPKDPLNYTILAKQQKGKLVKADIDAQCLYKGIKSQEEIGKKVKRSGVGATIFYFALTALFGFLALRAALKSKNTSGRKKSRG